MTIPVAPCAAFARSLLAAVFAFGASTAVAKNPSPPMSSFAMRDAAGHRQIPLDGVPDDLQPISESERCVPGLRVCFSLTTPDGVDQRVLNVRDLDRRTDAGAPVVDAVPLQSEAHENAVVRLWSLAVLSPPKTDNKPRNGNSGHWLMIGMLATDSAMTSGGFENVSRLWLYRVGWAGNGKPYAVQMLSVPYTAHRSTKVCFDAEDEQQRAGACRDELEYEATLILDPANASGLPVFDYRAFAGTYPNDIPLRSDAKTSARLSKADLVRRRDPDCTYRRKVAFNPATARYEFDRPGPACDHYLSNPYLSNP